VNFVVKIESVQIRVISGYKKSVSIRLPDVALAKAGAIRGCFSLPVRHSTNVRRRMLFVPFRGKHFLSLICHFAFCILIFNFPFPARYTLHAVRYPLFSNPSLKNP
jgi:hypothetical protein